MKIPDTLKSAKDIANYAIEKFGIKHDTILTGPDLFRFYVSLRENKVTEINIEQYNKDDGSYMIPPDSCLEDQNKIFGETITLKDPNPKATTEHVWVRHTGDYTLFVEAVSSVIEHAVLTHRHKLTDFIKEMLNEIKTVSEYENNLAEIK